MNKLVPHFLFIYDTIENLYTWLMGVFYEELFHGQRNPQHSKVLLALLLFATLSILYYFFDEIFDYFSMLCGVTIFLHQLFTSSTRWRTSIREELEKLSITSCFHEFRILLFLLIMSNFLPRSGHFILVFGGPYVGYYCPEAIYIDLSLYGIFSMFYIETVISDYIQVSILFFSLIWAIGKSLKSVANE